MESWEKGFQFSLLFLSLLFLTNPQAVPTNNFFFVAAKMKQRQKSIEAVRQRDNVWERECKLMGRERERGGTFIVRFGPIWIFVFIWDLYLLKNGLMTAYMDSKINLLLM